MIADAHWPQAEFPSPSFKADDMAGFLEHIAHRTRCFSIDSYNIVLPVMRIRNPSGAPRLNPPGIRNFHQFISMEVWKKLIIPVFHEMLTACSIHISAGISDAWAFSQHSSKAHVARGGRSSACIRLRSLCMSLARSESMNKIHRKPSHGSYRWNTSC